MRRALIAFIFVLATFGCLTVAAEWSVEAPQIATILLGIDCPNDRTCFAGAGQDGRGVLMLATEDGSTWKEVPLDSETAQMMFMSTAAHSVDSATTIGMGFPPTQFGNIKAFYNSAPYSLLAVSQNIGTVKGTNNWYGFAGDFTMEDGEMLEGLAISQDGGKNFRLHPIPREKLHGWPRYADYPSRTHWMVSTGSWPTTTGTRTADGYHHLSSRIAVRETAPVLLFGHAEDSLGVAAEYKAGITVTEDGGRTWTQLYTAEGYYLNQVKCVNTRTCFVVGEGRGHARIMKTDDFGKSWKTVWETNGGYDLMGLEVLSEREVWACGMQVVNGQQILGAFLHSLDGGQTWEETNLDEYFCVDMTFPTQRQGKAAAIDRYGQSSILKYSA